MTGTLVRGKSAVLAIAALAAGGVLLASCGPSKKQRAQYAEKNQHYTPPASLERAEYGSMVERRFRALDRDEDHYISGDEFPHNRVGEVVRALDKDGDGKVSAQEFSEGMLAKFDRLDLNHDRVLTWAEFQATMHPARPHARRHARR